MPGAESNTVSVPAAVAPATASKKQPLRATLDAVIARATPVYQKVTPYVTPVYQKVTPYVPVSVLNVAINATNAATTKVLSYGPVANAAVDAVDKKVVSVIDYIHSKESSLPSIPAVSVAIPVQWVAAVNSAVKPILSNELVADLQKKITHFYTVASTTLLELKEKNNTAVKREEFIRELRTKLAHQWDERLQKPAEELYEKSKTIVLNQVDAVSKNEYYQSLRSQLGEKWELAVQEVYHKRLESTLKNIYQTAAAYYLTLYQKGGEQAASLANYLQGLKTHLETTYPQYTGKIEPLLKQAYETIKNLVAKLPSLKKSPSAEQSAAAAAAVNTVASN